MREKNKLIKENKAITLIALVVTIVVLIILASISIGVLTGDKGIIKQSYTAKEDTEIASWEEQIDIAITNAEKKHRNPTLNDVKEELKNRGVIDEYSQVSDKGIITTNEPTYEIKGKLDDYIPFGPGIVANKNETYIDKNEDKVIVPEGFMISENEKEQIVDEGLVIKDESGNEFVWIPVNEEYERDINYEDTWVSTRTFTDTSYLPEGIQPNIDEKESNEKAEREAIVGEGKANGFYISRYEAGKETNGEGNILVSKKETEVWTDISQEDCKKEAKKFINNDNVKSALCSGIQWDMTMKFIDKKLDGKDGTFDVTIPSKNRHSSGIGAETGKNEADRVCNIYDLEGNYFEYVAERSSYSPDNSFVSRGGCYNPSYTQYPASYRRYSDGIEDSLYTFRFVLYVM